MAKYRVDISSSFLSRMIDFPVKLSTFIDSLFTLADLPAAFNKEYFRSGILSMAPVSSINAADHAPSQCIPAGHHR
jgi:ABC-type amino acid transport system permease subunit